MTNAFDQKDKLLLAETVGSALWFAMDGMWMFEAAGVAELLIGPTVVVNLLAFLYAQRSTSELSAVASANTWLWMNVLWMIGDLEALPQLVWMARLLFAAGLVALLTAVLSSGLQRSVLVRTLVHFRRLRW